MSKVIVAGHDVFAEIWHAQQAAAVPGQKCGFKPLTHDGLPIYFMPKVPRDQMLVLEDKAELENFL